MLATLCKKDHVFWLAQKRPPWRKVFPVSSQQNLSWFGFAKERRLQKLDILKEAEGADQAHDVGRCIENFKRRLHRIQVGYQCWVQNRALCEYCGDSPPFHVLVECSDGCNPWGHGWTTRCWSGVKVQDKQQQCHIWDFDFFTSTLLCWRKHGQCIQPPKIFTNSWPMHVHSEGYMVSRHFGFLPPSQGKACTWLIPRVVWKLSESAKTAWRSQIGRVDFRNQQSLGFFWPTNCHEQHLHFTCWL